jgi:DedD protein
MDVRVRERLIGALVLVAAVVLLVPAILKGRAPQPAAEPGAQTRRVEVPVGNASQASGEELEADPVPLAGPELTGANPLPAATPEPAETPPEGRMAQPTVAAPPPPPQEARPKPKASAAPVAAAGTAWAVQVAAFSTRSKAEQLVADLRKRRYAAFVLEYRASGKVLYRVRVGPEQDKARAAAIAERLAKDGYQPVVARHP